MKKKVALLLALVMVISMLPMQALTVFGADRGSSSVLIGAVEDDERNINITLPWDAFATASHGALRIQLEIGGDNAHNRIALDANDTVSSVLVQGTMVRYYDIDWTVSGVSSPANARGVRSVELILDSSSSDFGDITDGDAFETFVGVMPNLVLTVPVVAGRNNATITASILPLPGRPGTDVLIDAQSIVSAITGPRAGEVRITTGDAVNFTHDLRVPTINIREHLSRVWGDDFRIGNTGGNTTQADFLAIQLVAPRGFEWAEAARPGSGANAPAVRSSLGSFNNLTFSVQENANDRSVLFVTANLQPGNGRYGTTVGLDTIIIENFWIVPEDYDNIRSGNVNVDVLVGTASAATWAAQGMPTGWSTANLNALPGSRETLTVGTVGTAGLYFRTTEDNLPVLRSGVRWFGGANEVTNATQEDVTTATVTLSETIRGSWASSGFNSTEFYFGEGVQIVGATVRISEGGDYYRNSNRLIAPAEVLLPNNALTTSATEQFVLQASGLDGGVDREEYVGGRAVLRSDRLQVTMPLPQNPNRARTYHMEVEFQVSILAGYESIHGSELEVFIRGNTIDALPNADRGVVIAEVVDPISVTLVGGLQSVTVGHVNFLEAVEINDIVITEIEAGTLNRGETLNIGAAVLPFQAQGQVGIFGGTVIVDEASGLRVNVTRTATAIQLTVATESSNAPGVITISGANFMGPVFPGARYLANVFGGFSEITNASAGVTGNTANNANTNLPGLFDAIPYGVQIFEITTAVDGPEGTAPGRPGIVERLMLHADMQAVWSPSDNAYIANPFMMWQNPADNNQDVGMLSLRVFADFIGGETNWNQDTMTATVTGLDANGNSVTVSLTVGNNIATINGVQHDIATFATRLSGPPNTIVPIIDSQNRMFLPLRFISNAFLYPVQYQGGGVVSLG